MFPNKAQFTRELPLWLPTVYYNVAFDFIGGCHGNNREPLVHCHWLSQKRENNMNIGFLFQCSLLGKYSFFSRRIAAVFLVNFKARITPIYSIYC
jgi:hypothetical protein